MANLHSIVLTLKFPLIICGICICHMIVQETKTKGKKVEWFHATLHMTQPMTSYLGILEYAHSICYRGFHESDKFWTVVYAVNQKKEPSASYLHMVEYIKPFGAVPRPDAIYEQTAIQSLVAACLWWHQCRQGTVKQSNYFSFHR